VLDISANRLFKEKQMSKSPLAGAFTQNGAPEKKKNKKTGALLILAGVALTTSLGGVFAANITIASNGIEFGQGVAAVTTCDTTITSSIDQEYDNARTTFDVTRVTLSGIDVNNAACGGKTLKVSLLDSSGAAYCSIGGVDASSTLTLTSTAQNQSSDVIKVATGGTATDATVGINASADCAASGVGRVAITTSN
jgi:hypothetical protein